jgi:predicted DNA binding CopG/RHH family protein
MREEYDFSDGIKNPYAKELKTQMTIKVAPSVIIYFKEQSAETGIPYQTLINMYLEDCVKKKKKLEMEWK